MVQPGTEGDRTEHRQLTILFCDLVDSTALAARRDLEDLQQIVSAFLASCTAAIHRYDGYVARYMGDGVLAYFGYPEASEHDAERAVLAGLNIITAVRALPAQQELTLRSRVGIATGPVLVGAALRSGAADELAAIGETPNLAARLQSLAEADTVLVADATQRLTSGFFEWMDLGDVMLKGAVRPTRTWRALRERSVVDRFQARHGALRPAPLVDRRDEHDLLLQCWRRAEADEGAAVLLTGEAGIGKSRLIAELRASLTRRSLLPLRYFCSPHYRSSALHPIIKQIERAAGLSHADAPQESLGKIEALLAQAGGSMDGAVPVIAALLSIETAGRHEPLNLTAQQLKSRTLDALEEWVCALAARQAVLVVVEDLHWADPTTQELLDRLVERVRRHSILLLMTSRPEGVPSWAAHRNVENLVLHRLPHSDCLKLTEEIAGARRLPRAVSDRILAHADGIPLFVEELSRAVVLAEEEKPERPLMHGSLSPIRVPATLHDALMARLDRLGRWKEVAQVGALLGRRFSYEMLAAVAPNKEGIAEAIDNLVTADILRREGPPPDAVLTFKHALIQDIAVANLLRTRRKHLHARIAHTIESIFPETALREPELLAWHHMSAGLAEPAVAYCLKAAERALQRSANVEAISHLETGLELLESLPGGPERDRRELDLVTRLGAALTAAKGFGAPEVSAAYARARRVAERIEDPEGAFPVLRGLWVHNLVRAEWSVAMELAEHMLAVGERQTDQGYRLEGHRALGMTLLWLGELSRAYGHFERALHIYEPERHHRHAILYGNDPGVACLVHKAYLLCVLGHPDRAVAHAEEAEALARRLGHPFSLTQSMIYRAFVHQLRREPDDTLRLAQGAVRLASEQGFPFWHAEARMLEGWALAERGESEAGLASMRLGLAEFEATGALMDRPRWRCALAEVLGRAGQAAEARAVASEALALAQSTGERFYEARLLMLMGELCLQTAAPGDGSDAERYLEEALRVARSQGAKWWELRAASGLAGCWAQQRRVAQAIEVLAPCLARFEEGFGTVDLTNAAALLAELQRAGKEG